MSANRRCSTGSSARSWRWSTTSPASRATARFGEAQPAGARVHGRRHRRLGRRGPRQPARPDAGADRSLAQGRRRRAVRDRRARGAHSARRGNRRWLREQEVPVVLIANKAEGRAGDAGHPGKLFAWARRAGALFGRAWRRHGRSVRSAAAADRGADEEFDEDEPDGEDEDPRRPAQAGDRRAAQRRQVDPDQPPARRGPAADRARSRDHPRFDRGRLAMDRSRRAKRRSG